MLLTMIAALTVLGTEPQAQSRPSFDCARASTPVERAICRDPALGVLDRRMAERYAAVRRALTPEARAALLDDQRWFLESNEQAFEYNASNDYPSDLADRFRQRVAFLDRVQVEAGNSLIGKWQNLWGSVEITPAGSGRLHLTAFSAHPVAGRWLCEVEVVARPNGRSLVGLADLDEEWRVSAVLKSGFLEVSEAAVDGEPGSPGYCGMGGYVGGAYFRVR